MSEWRSMHWGDLGTLHYGKALRGYQGGSGPVEVFGTNGPIGWTDHGLFPAGVVVGRKGAYRGIHYARATCWVIDTAFWLETNPELVDPRWAFWQLRTVDLNSIDSGSAIPSTSRDAFAQIPVPLPPLHEQRRVVTVLDSLDELIENNRRRVEVLEEMAKAIYREWFVHFRYPGHENATFVDSALGPIPEGWEVSTCGEALVVLGGGTPSKAEPDYWEPGTIPWFTPSDLTKRPARFAAEPELKITEVGLAKSSARLFPKDSVLMTSRATLGVLAIATAEASCNQGFIVIPPDRRWPPSFIYEWLDSHAEHLAAIGTGATFKEITKGAFKKVPFLLPKQPVLDAFRAVVDPIDGEIQTLEASKRNLTSLRDLLLPKLVTGQIDVSSLDLDLVEAAG